VQAAVRGYRVVGFEINPYASLAANVKLNAIELDTRELEQTISQMKFDSCKWRDRDGDPKFAPMGFRSRIPFFSPMVEAQVLQALEFISNISDNLIRDLFRVTFGAVMVSFSNYSYEPSLSTRKAAGKALINEADVAGTLLEKLSQIQSDIKWLRAETGGKKPRQGICLQ